MNKQISDLKDELEMDKTIYTYVIENSTNQTSRNVCHGKLAIINKVLDFLKDNNL